MKNAYAAMKKGFHVVAGNDRSQAATMVLRPGDSEGGPENRHESSDQWLFVAGGTGEAVVAGKKHELRPGTLLLIEKGEAHEIRATGDDPLETLNFYVPPEY